MMTGFGGLRLFFLFLSCGVVLAVGRRAEGMEPPRAGELAVYDRDGSLAARQAFVKTVGNDKVRSDVAARALANMRRLAGVREPMATLPRWSGMPTKGTNAVLIILIDFSDYPHVNSESVISGKVFGDGVQGDYPRESLRNYYIRSSYSNLFLAGNVLGWHRMAHPRSWYTTQYGEGNDANRAVIDEAVQAFPSHNFRQYDNNGDGEVDYLAVIWTGPDTGWGNFWWGYQWTLNTPVEIGGVRIRSFSWQWESQPVGDVFQPDTLIHETGHALGLPDYYDYSENVGPVGGLGGLDMMDASWGDHNPFSKFMLEWLTPTVISSGSQSRTLLPSASRGDVVAIMPSYSGNTAFAEYFMVQNRYRTGNDTGYPSDGLLIWHVDARPDSRGQDFLYNNSDTAHKLLRLMEADGQEQIERGQRADSGDYYVPGRQFGDGTTPNSRSYAGSNTMVSVSGIANSGQNVQALFAVGGVVVGQPRIGVGSATLSQSVMAGAGGTSQTLRVFNSGSGSLAYTIRDNAAWLTVTPTNGSSSGATNAHTVAVSTAGLSPATYNAEVTISGVADNSPQTVRYTLEVMGGALSTALDAATLLWTTGGNAAWFAQGASTHDGVDAAQSGVIADSQSSWLQTEVTGAGLLSFWWSVSSEGGYDFLEFYVDSILVATNSGSGSEFSAWRRMTFPVTNSGAHTLRWQYRKDSSVSAGSDAGWVDEVSFVPSSLPALIVTSFTNAIQVAATGKTVIAELAVWNGGGGDLSYVITDDAGWLTVNPTNESSSGARNRHVLTYDATALTGGIYTAALVVSDRAGLAAPLRLTVTLKVSADRVLNEAVDLLTLDLQGGTYKWVSQSQTTHDGEDAAQSGRLGDDAVSYMYSTVQGPGTLSFWWKVSSEKYFDQLSFWLGAGLTSTNMMGISGEVAWNEVAVYLPSNLSYTVGWWYGKDYIYKAGDDAGWVDQVSFRPVVVGVTNVFRETFDAGRLPAGWRSVDLAGGGNVWTNSWLSSCRYNYTGGTGECMVIDSDVYSGCASDAVVGSALVTPPIDLTGIWGAYLRFKTRFIAYNGNLVYDEVCNVDMSVDGGSSWSCLFRWKESDIAALTLEEVLPDSAANRTNVMFRFVYTNSYDDYFWEIDDVEVSGLRGNRWGIPENWIVTNLGGLGNLTEDSDRDGDGFEDWKEYLAGTEPTNANSALKLADTGTIPAAGVVPVILKWQSVTGLTYTVARSTNAISGAFGVVAGSLPGRAGWTVYTDNTAIGVSPLLYRVELGR